MIDVGSILIGLYTSGFQQDHASWKAVRLSSDDRDIRPLTMMCWPVSMAKKSTPFTNPSSTNGSGKDSPEKSK
jgi:hypothetical protein